MASKSTGEPLDPAILRAQHSIIYEDSTCEIKDDAVQLSAVVKTGTGPVTRTEALFLLFYHALRGEDGASELIAAGVVNILLSVLEQPDASAPDKTCCAGILVALCSAGGEEACEAVIKGRAGVIPATAVLHGLLHGTRDAMRMHAARCLALVAAQPGGRSALLRALDNSLSYCQLYCDVLAGCGHSEAGTVGQLANYLTALIKGRDDLRDQALQGGLMEAATAALRLHKVDSTVRGCLLLLEEMLNEKRAWGRLASKAGIELLVDLLGPPPSTILRWEDERYRHIIDPDWAAEQDRKRDAWLKAEAERQAEAAKAAQATGGRSFRSHGSRASKSSKSMKMESSTGEAWADDVGAGEGGRHLSPSRRPSQKDLKQSTSTNSNSGAPFGEGEEGGASTQSPPVPGAEELMVPAPPRTLEQLLSHNTAGLKWHALATLPTFAAAAGCLYTLAQDKELMEAMSTRAAASRLVPLLNKAMDDEGGAGGKKKGAKKKKGLSLTPEQTQHLVRITGALKFLSLTNMNRYRVAKLGGIKALILIYENCGHTLLRRNAQVILSNAALLAENGQMLLDAKLPEEFLVSMPMRLTPEEIEQLLVEFPDASLGPKAAGAAVGPAGLPAVPSVK